MLIIVIDNLVTYIELCKQHMNRGLHIINVHHSRSTLSCSNSMRTGLIKVRRKLKRHLPNYDELLLTFPDPYLDPERCKRVINF